MQVPYCYFDTSSLWYSYNTNFYTFMKLWFWKKFDFEIENTGKIETLATKTLKLIYRKNLPKREAKVILNLQSVEINSYVYSTWKPPEITINE